MADLTRRDLIVGAAGVGLSAASASVFGAPAPSAPMSKEKFRLKYAPHFGMFSNSAGNDLVDQLKFAADEGFHGWEDNGMPGRSVADQERVAKAMADLKITMGVFVVNGGTAWGPSLSTGAADGRDKFLAECRAAVDVAKRVNAKWMTVVPGTVAHNLHPAYQTAHVVDALRRACEIFEPHGLVMVLEPLNFRDHPELFLTDVAQGYLICKAVNSPSCKVLYDLYHTQIQEGNLIPNIDLAWSEVAYYQCGDNPGRNEPTTGEVNYRRVFGHLHARGWQGIIGMEHGKSKSGKEGERALIEAYRFSDSF